MVSQPLCLDEAVTSQWMSPSGMLSLSLGGGGVQGQGKGQRLMGIKAVSDYIVLATCQNKIYKK